MADLMDLHTDFSSLNKDENLTLILKIRKDRRNARSTKAKKPKDKPKTKTVAKSKYEHLKTDKTLRDEMIKLLKESLKNKEG